MKGCYQKAGEIEGYTLIREVRSGGRGGGCELVRLYVTIVGSKHRNASISGAACLIGDIGFPLVACDTRFLLNLASLYI